MSWRSLAAHLPRVLREGSESALCLFCITRTRGWGQPKRKGYFWFTGFRAKDREGVPLFVSVWSRLNHPNTHSIPKASPARGFYPLGTINMRPLSLDGGGCVFHPSTSAPLSLGLSCSHRKGHCQPHGTGAFLPGIRQGTRQRAPLWGWSPAFMEMAGCKYVA